MSWFPDGVNPYFLGALGTLAAGTTGALLQVRAKAQRAKSTAISEIKVAAHERGWLDQTDSLPRVLMGGSRVEFDATFVANNPGITHEKVRRMAESLTSVARARRLEKIRLLSLLLIPAFVIVAASGAIWPEVEWVLAAALGFAIVILWLFALA